MIIQKQKYWKNIFYLSLCDSSLRSNLRVPNIFKNYLFGRGERRQRGKGRKGKRERSLDGSPIPQFTLSNVCAIVGAGN